MLYITTKDKNNVHTAHKALHNSAGTDGGYFVPFRLLTFTKEEMRAMKTKSFSQNIADVINLFFSTSLTAWDVDFTLGRNVAKIKQLPGKTYVAELWHNAGGTYHYLEKTLYNKICGFEGANKPSTWFSIALRIAILFALYADFAAADDFVNEQTVDLCVTAGEDITIATAVFYAKQMGLPIGKIICTCEENSSVWEFLYRGICQKKTTFPTAFDCLIHAALGNDGLEKYLECKAGDSPFAFDEECLNTIHENMYISAVGQRRVNSVIASTYSTNHYVFTTNVAMAFGGLQDYRASTGESRSAFILQDISALVECDHITKILGISKKELSDII